MSDVSPLPHEHRALDAVRLLNSLVDIVCGNWATPGQFESLARDMGLPDGEPTIQFLTGVRALISDLPEKIFISSDTRRAVLVALQDALDATIDREEAMAEQAEQAPEAKA